MTQPDSTTNRVPDDSMAGRPQGIWLTDLARPQPAPPWSVGDMIQSVVALVLGVFLVGSTSAVLLSGAAVDAVPDAASLLLGWSIGLLLTGLFVWFSFRRTIERYVGCA